MKQVNGIQQQTNTTKNSYTESYDLFFKIWRDIYLKDIITEFIELEYSNCYLPYNESGDWDNSERDIQDRFKNITLIFEYPEHFYYISSIKGVENIKGVDLRMYFSYNYDPVDTISNLPKSIKRLTLQYFQAQDIIPDWITHLTLYSIDSDLLAQDSIPSSVTHLSLFGFKKIHKNSIPSSVRFLVIDDAKLEIDSIPSSVVSIKFKKIWDGNTLKESIDLLPSTVKNIDFDLSCIWRGLSDIIVSKLDYIENYYYLYDYKIDPSTRVLYWEQDELIKEGDIPNTVRRIIFGEDFNQIILPNTIPNSVMEINFGSSFNQDLSNLSLPSSLTSISFHDGYKKEFNFEALPPCIKYFSCYPQQHHTFDKLPRSVSHFSFSNDGMKIIIPPHVKHVKEFRKHYDQCSYSDKIYLPRSIQSFQVEREIEFYDDPPEDDPSPLEIGTKRFSSPLDGSLGLKDFQVHLKVDESFTDFIRPGSLISNIKSIQFQDYNQILLKGAIPDSVTEIDFGVYFNSTFTLPSSLKVVKFGFKFEQELPIGIFPPTVEEIHFGVYYDKRLEPGVLPPNLKVLSFPYHDWLFEILPESIQELNLITSNSNGDLSLECSFSAKTLPQSLTKLTLGRYQSIYDLDDLPPSIKYLKLGDKFNGQIPNTVESIEFHSRLPAPFKDLFK